jgi:hypothetical protein
MSPRGNNTPEFIKQKEKIIDSPREATEADIT